MKKLVIILLSTFFSLVSFAQKNRATVEKINGVCVFSDCKPVADYELLGEITFGGSDGTSLVMVGGLTMISGSTPQYNDIRSGLVTNAVLANRSVEGIIITTTSEGFGRASMIKFKAGQFNTDQAIVNRYNGVYVFCDCIPNQEYTYLGENSCGGLDSSYDALRNRLIKNALKKHKDTEGVILHFKTGGKDKAEAIKF